MKKIKHIPLFFLTLSLTITALAETPNELFVQGNQFYQEKNYSKAIDTYSSAIDQKVSASLYYNLGNAYFKNEEPGYAILAYNKALKLNPRDSETLTNLNYVHSLEGIKNTYRTHLTKFSSCCKINTWVLCLTITFWVILALLVLKSIYSWNSLLFYSSTTIGFCCLLLAFVALIGYHKQCDLHVVLSKEASLQLAPTSNSPLVADLPPGSIVQKIKKLHGYAYVKISNTEKGWIPEQALGKIWD